MKRGIRGLILESDTSSSEDGQAEKIHRYKSKLRKTEKSDEVTSQIPRKMEAINHGSSSGISTRKQRNIISVSEDTSSSDEEILRQSKKGYLKPLSDYDTGDNSGEGSSGMASRSSNSRTVSPEVGLSLEAFELSDSSSDCNITRSTTHRTRSRIISSSDSSDSGVPVFARRNKRMRIDSSSSNSSNSEDPNSRTLRINRTEVNVNCRFMTLSNNTLRLPSNVRQTHSVNNERNRTRGSSQAVVTQGSSIANRTGRRRTRNFSARNTSSTTLRQRSTNPPRSRNGHGVITRVQSNQRATRRNQRGGNNWNITTTATQSHPEVLFDSSDDSDFQVSSSTVLRNRIILNSSSSSLSSTSSDSSSSSSSSSSDQIIVMRNRVRRGVAQALTDSDDESDSNSAPLSPDIEESNTNLPMYTANDSKINSNQNNSLKNEENSSDSESETDKCPICFGTFKSQEIGTPEVCEHCFCLKCIQEWAKNNNTCPVDRKVFNSITVRAKLQGEVIRKVPIPPAQRVLWEPEDVWTTVVLALNQPTDDESSSFSSLDSNMDGPEEICYVCRSNDRSDSMIACDFCFHVFHMDCVEPPLQYVPVNDWYCSSCRDGEMESYSDSTAVSVDSQLD